MKICRIGEYRIVPNSWVNYLRIRMQMRIVSTEKSEDSHPEKIFLPLVTLSYHPKMSISQSVNLSVHGLNSPHQCKLPFFIIFEQQIRPFLLPVVFSNYSYSAENFLPSSANSKNRLIVRITNSKLNIRHIPS